jgi:hypothetical protein
MRLASARGCRFELQGERVIVVGNAAVLAELAPILRPHKPVIRALLEEWAAAPSPSDAVLAAAKLLRFGLWPPTRPEACTFHCGPPGGDCRRCGATWLYHTERAAGRDAPVDLRR